MTKTQKALKRCARKYRNQIVTMDQVKSYLNQEGVTFDLNDGDFHNDFLDHFAYLHSKVGNDLVLREDCRAQLQDEDTFMWARLGGTAAIFAALFAGFSLYLQVFCQ